MSIYSEIQGNIDWSLMVSPHDSGYDSIKLLESGSWSGKSTTGISLYRDTDIPVTERVFFENEVLICPAPSESIMSRHFAPASVDNPNLLSAARMIESWPAACSQFKRLISIVYPYTDPGQNKRGFWSLGSSSFSDGDSLSCLHVTVDNNLGLAQGLIKEMAHQKLRALGISFDGATHLIANDQSPLYKSPVRNVNLWPMTILVHDQYSFVHVTALDLYMLNLAESGIEREHILMLLARNIPRLEMGHEILSRHLKTDENGSFFFDALFRWTESLLQQGQKILDDNGYGNA